MLFQNSESQKSVEDFFEDFTSHFVLKLLKVNTKIYTLIYSSIYQHLLHVCSEWVCVGHLGSVILSLSHFCISARLMEDETKLIGPSLWGRGLLWARLRAKSSLCLLGITLSFPSSPSSSFSSSSFNKILSLRVMMSGSASLSLSNHSATREASCGTLPTPSHTKQQHPQTGRARKWDI